MSANARLPLLALICCGLIVSAAAAVEAADKLIQDDYAQSDHPQRNAARGDWTIGDGIASVTQDDDLYKKYKNHGPIMIYNVPHKDASAVVEFRPQDCQSVVFTMDAADGGHAFRIRLVASDPKRPKRSSSVVTYAEKKPGDKKAEMIVLINQDVPALQNGAWTRLEATVIGDTATVKIGDQVIRVQHPQIDQDKKLAKLGFSFGSLDIRRFELQAE